MNKMKICKAAVVLVAAISLFSAGVLTGKNSFNQPSSILHLVTVQWKSDSTPEQQQAALNGVKIMAAEVPGIKNVWIKTIRVQPREFNAAFAIEFENKAAAD